MRRKHCLTKNLIWNKQTISMSIPHEYMFVSAGCLESPPPCLLWKLIYSLHNSTLHQPASKKKNALSLITHNFVMSFENVRKRSALSFPFFSFSLCHIRLDRPRILIAITLKFLLKRKRFSSETWNSVTKYFLYLYF